MSRKKCFATDEERVFANVNITADASQCWEWNKSLYANGYGQAKYKYQGGTAHRLIYELVHGVKLSTEEYVLHWCDNRKCCNPDHLWVGSADDNWRDCVAKGRYPSGSKWRGAKLNDSQVAEIRQKLSEGLMPSEIMKILKLPTTVAAVTHIKHGKSWRLCQPHQN